MKKTAYLRMIAVSDGETMTLEVNDCTSVFLTSEDLCIEPISQTPKGLASIPDSMTFRPPHPKPSLVKRLFLTLILGFVHLSTWTVQVCDWVVRHLFGTTNRQKTLYSQLYHIAKKGTAQDVENFLKKHAEEESSLGFLFGEFLSLPETFLHMPEILKGANVCLHQDQGFFCHRWKGHPHAYRRISSHEYQENECYAVGHLLFWLDLEGNTRFQFEKSPLQGFFSRINHFIDFLRYRRDNMQQGIAGDSPYTEHYCLYLRISPSQINFLSDE